MQTPTDIVITGCGMLSALGIGLEESAAAWAEGESACFPAARTVPPPGVDALAGEVPDFILADILPTPKAYLDRHSELLLAATALARTASSVVAESFVAERVGLAMGSAWGGLQTLDLFFEDYIKKGPRLVKPMLFPHSYANAAISLVAMEWSARGPHLNFASGNDASTQALLAALDMLRNNEADLVMAGGAEGLNVVRWRARIATGLSTAPGEGAAVFLIEREATAKARGIRPLARLLGGATANDLPERLRTTCTATIDQALDDAKLRREKIRTIITSTPSDHLPSEFLQAAVRHPADLYGDVEGASGALQSACALLDAPALLPAIILTQTASGSAAALVMG